MNKSSKIKVGVIIILFLISLFFSIYFLPSVSSPSSNSINNSPVAYGYNWDVINNFNKTYTKIFYAEPVYFDKFVKLTDDGEDFLLEWGNNKVKIKLNVKEKNKEEKHIKDFKKNKTDIDYTKSREYRDFSYKFSYNLTDKKAKKLNIEDFSIEVENLTNMDIVQNGNKFYFPDGIVLDLQDLVDSNYTLEKQNNKKIKIKAESIKGRSFDVSEIFLDPKVSQQYSSKDTRLDNGAGVQDGSFGSDTTVVFDNGDTKALVDFNILSIPKNSSVTNADVYLYFGVASSTDVKTAYPISKLWNEGPTDADNDAVTNGTTWLERWFGNNANDGCSGDSDEDWCNAGMGTSDYNTTYSSTFTGGTGYLSFDVTTWINMSINGLSNFFGFVLINQDGTEHAFYTKEWSGTSRDPYMNITYNYPQPIINLNNPANNTINSSRVVDFQCNATMLGKNADANITRIEVAYSTSYGDFYADIVANYTLNRTQIGQPNRTVIVNWTTTISDIAEEYYWSCIVDITHTDGVTESLIWDKTYKLTIDYINPRISIITPSNNTNSSNTGLNINYTASDTNLASCWYSNDSMSLNTTLSNCANITTVTWSEGIHNVRVYVNDTAGNTNSSSVRFVIDTTNPLISITTPSNNTNSSNTGLDINYTASDTNLASCWYSNDSYSLNTTLSNCANITTVTWSEGIHNVRVYVNDSAGNINSSSVRFTIDTTNPSISITTPSNNTNSSNNALDVNYTYTETNLASCWYSNDSMSLNTTLSNCANITTVTWSEGTHNVRVYVNDTFGNTNSSSVRFTIDSIIPSISIITPSNNTNSSSAGLNINYTASDTNLASCWYSNDSMSLNTTLSNCANITTVTWSEGTHNVRVYVNDTFGNTNSSSVRFTIDSIAPRVKIDFPSSINYSRSNMDFNFSLNEAGSCRYTLNTGVTNYTMTANSSNSGFNATNSSISQGIYRVRAYCNDTIGNNNLTEFVDFELDTTNPSVNITFPEALTYTSSITSLNYTVSDTNLASCWYSLNSGATNTTITCGQNVTGLDSGTGISTWTVYSNDSAGNRNSSSVTFSISSLTVNSPTNNQQSLNNRSVVLNVTTVTFNNTVWYTWNKGIINGTLCTKDIECIQNQTVITFPRNATYNLSVYSNRSNGVITNVTVSNITIGTFSNINPNVTLITINDTNFTSSTVVLEYNLTDDNDYVINSSLFLNSTKTYLPNMAGGAGWNGSTSTSNMPPSSLALDNETSLTSSDLNTISTDDDSFFNNSINSIRFPGIRVRFNITENVTDISNITITVRGYGRSSLNEFALHIWNSTNWVYLANHTSSSKDSVISSLSSNLSNYIDSNGSLFILVESSIIGSFQNSYIYLHYAELKLNAFEIEQTTSYPKLNQTLSFTLTSTENGIYRWYVQVCDSDSSCIYSDKRTFTVDTIGPGISIISPEEKTYIINTTYFNVSLTEEGSWCGFSLDHASNTTMTKFNATYFNYTQNVTDGKHNVTFFCNDTDGNMGSSVFREFAIDTIPPAISLEIPLQNAFLNNGTNVYFNYTPTSATGVDTCELWGNWTGTWHNNQTDTSITNASTNFFTVNITDGTYIWIVWCNNTLGNSDWSSQGNKTFTIDTTYPLISYETQTSVNDANLSQNSIYVNVTYTEINFANISFTLKNDTNTVNSTFFSTTIYQINWTSLADNNYTYYVNITDKSNNKNSTSIRIITLDTTNPNVTLISPSNNSFNSTTSQNFTANLSDNLGIKNATLYIYNETGSYNQTNTNFIADLKQTTLGIVVSLIDGVYNWWYKVWDWAGNSFSPSANRTITIDSTLPLIDYTTGTSANDTNTTNTFIFVNVTVTELREDTITFLLYNSTGQVNSTSSTNFIRTINWTGLIDNTYYYNVTINDSSNNKNSTRTRLIRLDDTPPKIKIIFPVLGNNYNYNNSINLNYSVTDNIVGVNSCWYKVENASIGGIVDSLIIGNTTISGCLNTTFSLPSGDINYVITLYANDTLNNREGISLDFGIRTESPAINLHNPSSYQNLSYINNIRFNFTATYTLNDVDAVDTCELWGNWTGTWSRNQTLTNVVSGTQTNFNLLNLTEGYYLWNVWCNNTLGTGGWSTNRTFTTDITFPVINITNPLNGSTQTVSSVNINYTLTELNVEYKTDSCRWTKNNGANNVTLTCRNNITGETFSEGSNTIIIYARDTAGNENSSSVTFTVDTSQPSGGGGGGGITTPETSTVAIIQPLNITKKDKLQRAILYARIRESCNNETNCKLNEEKYSILLDILKEQGVDISLEGLIIWLNSYNENELESVKIFDTDVKRYNLFTGVLQVIGIPFQIIPSKMDRFWIVTSPNFRDIVKSNKILKSCAIVKGDFGWNCSVSDSTAEINFYLVDFPPEWITRTFTATISYTNRDGVNIFQEVTIRAIYLEGKPIKNIPIPFYVLLIIFSTSIILLFIYIKPIRRKLRI